MKDWRIGIGLSLVLLGLIWLLLVFASGSLLLPYAFPLRAIGLSGLGLGLLLALWGWMRAR